MKQTVKNLLGGSWQYLRVSRQLARVFVAGFGQYPRECELCGHKGAFLAEVHFPDIFNFDALCPECGSLPRNRLLWHAVTTKALLHADDAMLHFAPETALRERLRAKVGHYATADLFAAGVDHVLDITAIALPDESWDVALASHVLEHVDDKKAFAELFRILRPGGRMLILVPVAEGWETTYENGSIVDPQLKALHFGKDNHVRRYGRDIRDRIAAAGFEVEAFKCDGATSVRLGLLPGENLFIGRKPMPATNG